MAESSWPSPSGGRSVSDTQYEALVSGYAPDGLIGKPSDAQPCYGDSSGMQVSFRVHSQGLVRGHLWDSGSTVINLSITSNATGQTRYDMVVLRLDRSTFDITAVVRVGTPGAGVPSYTQTPGTSGVWEIPVASVRVGPGVANIGGSDVTTAGWFLVRGGGISCTSITRPPHDQGLRIFEDDTNRQYISTGTSWILAVEDTGWQYITALGSAWNYTPGLGGLQPAYRRVNGIIFFRTGELVRNSNLSSGTNTKLFDIPAGFRATYNHRITGMLTGGWAGNISFNHISSPTNANEVWLLNPVAMSTGYICHMPDASWPVD